jgi:hypothetical protein
VCRPLFDAARPSRDQPSLVWTARGLPSGPQNKESKPSTSTAWVSGTHSLLSSRRFITFSITFRNRFRPSMYTFIVGMFTMGTSGWTAWLHHAVQACEIIQISNTAVLLVSMKLNTIIPVFSFLNSGKAFWK